MRIQPSSCDTTACQLGSNGALEIERAAPDVPDVLSWGASITTEGERDVSSLNNGSLTPESDDRGHPVVGERLPDEESVDSN